MKWVKERVWGVSRRGYALQGKGEGGSGSGYNEEKAGNQIITKSLLHHHHPASFLHQPHVMWVCRGRQLTHRLILTKCLSRL